MIYNKLLEKTTLYKNKKTLIARLHSKLRQLLPAFRNAFMEGKEQAQEVHRALREGDSDR